MTFQEYLLGANKYWREHPEQRKGQAYFNYLSSVNSELANSVCYTTLDPFYVDAKLRDFLVYVEHKWEEPKSEDTSSK